MSKKQKQQLVFAAISVAISIFAVVFVFKTFTKAVQIALFCAIPAIIALFCLGIFLKKDKIYKVSLLLVYFGSVILIAMNLVIRTGLFDNIDSVDELVSVINSFGLAGKAIFILIQFLQVTFIPIPSTIVTAAGAALYPAWEAIMLCCIGLWIGSIFAFFLGRTFGVKLVKWCIGEDMLLKYNSFVKGKDKAMLIYMFIFPVFPDDMLCLIAGLTTMSYPSFIMIQLISRPINVACTVLFVDNIMSIPFTGWGIAVWILIAIIFLGVFILMWKYAEKLESFMLKLISKITGRPVIKDINAIYRIKTPVNNVVKVEKTADEIYQENTTKFVNIANTKKARQIESLNKADETAEKILNKEDEPIMF